MRKFCFLTLLFVLALSDRSLSQSTKSQASDQGGSIPIPTSEEMSGWIDHLGSGDYAKRQLATLRLEKYQQDAIPLVIEAANEATGEKADRLLHFLGSIASDPSSGFGKLAFDSLNELAASRTTSKSIRAEKILQVIGAEQRDNAIESLVACKASVQDRMLQVMSGRVDVKQPLVVDRSFTGNAADLSCLKWMIGIEFARLKGPQIDRAILEQVITLPQLKKLQLIETKLTVDDLSVLQNAPDLDLLEIIYSPIGDEAVELITRLPVWGNVYLFGTQVTPSGNQKLKSSMDGVELFVSRGGFLGVQCGGNSLVIDKVVPNGAAQMAGLRPRDRLLSVNGAPITLFDDLRKQLANFAEGEEVSIEFERLVFPNLDASQFDIPIQRMPTREKFQLPVILGKREDDSRG